MTPDLLQAAGEALYGPRWRRELGRRLGFDDQQIRRWASGLYRPPPDVWSAVADLCRGKADALAEMAERARAAGRKAAADGG